MAISHKMKYVNLGKSGLKISKIVLGCMSYGKRRPEDNWNWVLEEDEALKHLKFAYDHGINTFDTADTYSQGHSERILGKFLKTYDIPRESVVILTKTYFGFGPEEQYGPAGYVNNSRLSRKRIFAAVKDSLARLGTDYVDVFQCHRFDNDTPIEETMQALHDIVQAGHARYIGMSSCWAWQFQLMQQYAIQNRLTPFISMQNYHNALYREEEREMMPTLQHFGVGSIPWSPLGGGLLTRPYSSTPSTSRSTDHASRYASVPEASQAIISTIQRIAESKSKSKLESQSKDASPGDKVSMAQVALAWSLSKPFISAPIVGTTKIEQLEDMIKGVNVELTEKEIEEIDRLYEVQKVQGHA